MADEPIIKDWGRAGLVIAVVVLAILGAIALGSLKNQADRNGRALKADCALTKQVQRNRKEAIAALAKSKRIVKKHPHIISDITLPQWRQIWATQQRAIDGQAKTIRVLRAALGDSCK